MNKFLTKIATAFVGMTMAIGVGVALGANREVVPVVADGTPTVYKTAKFGSAASSSQSINNYTSTGKTSTYNGFTVLLDYCNNNNNNWAYMKTGNSSNASKGAVRTQTAIDKAITSVDVTIDAITTSKTNSINLYTSSNGSSWTKIGSYTKGTGTKRVSIDEPAADLYYKVEFDCQKGSSNGIVTVSKIEYYYLAATQHTVNYNENVGETGDEVTGMPDPESADENKSYTLNSTATPKRAGYTFYGWGENASSTTPITSIDVGTEDVTVYAIWKAISGVSVSEKTAITGNMRGQAYYEVQATVSGDTGVSSNVTWSITSTNTYNKDTTTITDKASIDNNGKIVFEDNAEVYAWATAADGSTHNSTGFKVTASALHGTSTNPYTVAEAKAAIDAGKGMTGVYVSGIISKIDSFQSSTITYWISDDGTATNQFEVFKGKALNNVSFNAQTDLQVGDIVTVYGNITLYSTSTYEFSSGNYQTAFKRLDSISLSIDTAGRTFNAGDNFSFGGTVSASYKNYAGQSAGDPETVDNDKLSFRLGSTTGTVVTTDTILKRSNNGNSLYVLYNDKNVNFTLIVNDGPVDSVSLSSYSATIILGASFNVSTVNVTVNDDDIANPEYEWVVNEDDTTASNYTFLAGVVTASNNDEDAGDIILRARSKSDTSKYAEFTLTVTAEGVVYLVSNTLSGYVTKTVTAQYSSVANMSTPTSWSWQITEGSEYVSINGAANTGTLVLNCLAAGTAKAKLTVFDGSKYADTTATITVNEYVVSSVDWDEPEIKVYSGATLTASDADDWNVKITTNAGETNKDIDHNLFTVKLGGSALELPHTWTSADDGKSLCVEYYGVSSTSKDVRIVQTLNNINKTKDSSDLVFTSACGGSGTADDNATWKITSDSAESTYESARGIHYGTSNVTVTYVQLESENIATADGQTITRVVVNTTDATGTGSLTVKVGSTDFKYGNNTSVTVSSTQSSYIFTGSAQGKVVVKIDRGSATKKAIYVKSISVSYTLVGDPVQMSNVSGHEDAQYYVVKFAKAFNAAMDDTEECTTGLNSAWATAAEAYDTFLDDISTLSATEQKYAKNMLVNATAQWTKGTDLNYAYCLERAMKTYDVCVTTHNMNPFMSLVRSTPASSRLGYALNVASPTDTTFIILLIVSFLGISAIAGYFLLKRRKEN